MNLKLHHIGVASQNIEKEYLFFEKLGYHKVSKVFCDEIQKIKGVFISADNQPTLELLENLSPNGPLTGYLQKNNKFYHFAYETDDIENDVKQFMTETHAIMVCPITQATYFYKICFLMLRNMMLIEFVQKSESKDNE